MLSTQLSAPPSSSPSDTRIVLLDIKGGAGSVSRSRSLSDRDALGKLGIQSRRSAARIIFQLDQQPIHRNPLPLPPPTHRRRAGSLRKTAFEYSNNQIRVYVFIFIHLYSFFLPLVLWRCWLGGRKGIRPVKNWVVGCWCGYLSGARCRFVYGPADATATATRCLLLLLQ